MHERQTPEFAFNNKIFNAKISVREAKPRYNAGDLVRSRHVGSERGGFSAEKENHSKDLQRHHMSADNRESETPNLEPSPHTEVA
jgi:hypothetical protein